MAGCRNAHCGAKTSEEMRLKQGSCTARLKGILNSFHLEKAIKAFEAGHYVDALSELTRLRGLQKNIDSI